MKNKFTIGLLFTLLVVSFVSQACLSSATTMPKRSGTTPLATLAPSPLATVTPPLTLNLLPGYTPPPTLIPDDEARLAELLQSKDCRLPCYLGITPRKTSISEAMTIMENLGAHYDGELDNRHAYDLDIGNPLIPTLPPNRDALVGTSVSLTNVNGIVQTIQVGILTEKTPVSLETFRKYWSRYSAGSIFAELGEPDQLYTGEGKEPLNRELIIVYERLGAYIRIRGSRQENNFCPKEERQEILMFMGLFDPASGLTIEEFNPYLTNPVYWHTVKEVLGIDAKEFYQKVVSDPSVCFDAK